MDRQNEGSEDPPQGGWSCWTWEVSCHIGMGIHRSHLKRIVMTLYLVYPLLLYICPVWGKDHSITVILFNDRYQKVLNLLKKTLDYMERFCYCQLSWICVNATYYIYNNQRTSRFSLFLSKLYVYLSPIVWKVKVPSSNLKTRFFIFPITSGIFQPIFSYFIFF